MPSPKNYTNELILLAVIGVLALVIVIDFIEIHSLQDSVMSCISAKKSWPKSFLFNISR